MTSDPFWSGGDHVEVMRVVFGAAVYFPATVVSKPSVRKNLIWVEHTALTVRDSVRMKEYVDPTHLRPSPPREIYRLFKPGDEVDVFTGCEGCWVRGYVTSLLENSRYIVEFNGENRPDKKVEHFNLRLHREWKNGIWVPSLLQQSNALESMFKGVRLKIKFRRRDEHENETLVEECYKPPLKKLKSCERAEKKFNKGMMVEVRSDEQGYEGSWFSAKIISYLGKNKYIVEYQTLVTDDGTESLKEEAKCSDIRPTPPPLLQKIYKLNGAVDAWYNEGWWSGRVYKINDNQTRYGVYFKTADEKLEFTYNDLRPCQVWIKEKWSRV